jgi:plasmid maintenance system antidote protein VapI
MTENQRFKSLIDFLIANRKVRNQQQFVEEIHSDKATVSQIKNGKQSISNEMFTKITDAFPYISSDWLKEEKGEMLVGDRDENTVNGNNNISVAGRGNQVNSEEALLGILEIQRGFQEMMKTSQAHLTESQMQMNKLITIIEQLNNKLS